MLSIRQGEHRSLFKKLNRLLIWMWQHPPALILLITLLLTSKIILFGRLVYGDIPYFDVETSKVNFLYAWGSEQFGTPVRQSFNTFRDALILLVAWTDSLYYFIKYVLPIILVPFVYYFILSKIGINNRFTLIIGSVFPLSTPIVFGDFLTGQTFWVYLTIPFVFYFAISIFCWKQFTLKNNLLLALFLFLSLGMLPPIIIPLMAAVALLGLVMFITDFSKFNLKLLGNYFLSAFTVFIALFLLAAPYILVASSGQQAYTPPSLLGDYYHNYAETNLLNTFRLGGNNGNGQSTLDYNSTSITNLVGYILLLGALVGSIALGLRERSRDYKAMLVGLLTVLLAILGFMHLLNVNTTFGIKVFESQWLVSTVRSPSKLFVIMLPIFTILFATSLQYVLERFDLRWQKITIGVATVLVLAIYGWPALRGDFGLLFQREDQLATYKQDQTVKQAVAAVGQDETRSLLMPTDHRDELNYQYLSPGFNVLRLEGGLPNTTELTNSLNESLNDRSPYFFNYLDAAGIKNAFIQKDAAAYEYSMFDLFPVELSPEKTSEFVGKNLTKKNETASFWQYQNKSSNELLFSPQQLVTISDENNLKSKAPFLDAYTAVIDKSLPAYEDFSKAYIAKETLQDGETVPEGVAQLHDPRLLLVDLYSRWQGSERYVVFDIINPLTGEVHTTTQHKIDIGTEILIINDERYAFNDEKKRVTMRSGDYDMETGKLERVAIDATDPSFETGPVPNPSDASPSAEGKPRLYSKEIDESTDGSNALLLGSHNHKGFIEKELQLDDPSAQYLLTFDYKNLQGDAPSFTILQDEQSLLFGGGQLDRSEDWQQHDAYFQPFEDKPEAAKVKLFFYTEGTEGNTSENAFDNVRLSKVDSTGHIPISLPNYPPHYELRNYRHTAQSTEANQNLLDNASFEDTRLWGEVRDASEGGEGEAKINTAQTDDAAKGEGALKLESDNHTAYVAQKASHFKQDTVYKLSFHYKHITGRKPAFAVWQNGASIAQPSKELKGGESWNYFETYFVPDQRATNLGLYFYSRSTGNKTINLFDDVKLQPASLISTYLIKNHEPVQQPQKIIKSYERLNPTLVKVTMRPGKGMTVLNESFHEGWKAYVVPKDQAETSLGQKLMLSSPGKAVERHVMVNGFANGWWLDSSQYPEIGNSEYTMILRYEPQKYLYTGFIGSAATLAGISWVFTLRPAQTACYSLRENKIVCSVSHKF